MSQDHAPGRTNWALVFILIGAGVVCAFQIGKAPPALPAIREEMGLDLVFAGWVIAVYALFAAALGVFGGAFSDAAGYRRSLIFGLACISLGSISGSFAPGGFMLLAARFVEAVGYLPIVVSVPALLGRCTASEGDRRVAAGIWGAYMPAGTALMMVLAPVFLDHPDLGWRGLWLINGMICGIYAVALAVTTRTLDRPQSPQPERRKPHRDVADVIRSPGPLLLGLFFATYAGNYLTVYGFLPTMLIEDLGVTRSEAALLSAFAVVVNVGGNVFGGWLRKKNVPFAAILICGSIFTGLTAIGIFSGAAAPELRYFMAVLYSAFCGVMPGATWSAAGTLAPRPELTGTTVGWVVQGGNIGTLVLPPITAALVSAHGGWHAAIWAVAGASAFGVLLAMLIARFAARAESGT